MKAGELIALKKGTTLLGTITEVTEFASGKQEATISVNLISPDGTPSILNIVFRHVDEESVKLVFDQP